MRYRLALLTITLLAMLQGRAQFVNFGQDRASLRWKQIKTDRFQIIYPDFFEIQAQRAANIYERLYRHANSLHVQPRKISMILHADGGISNGNVALAPRKSELYTLPPQEPTDAWLEHLCVHEFRHVQQFDKVNQGMTKGLSYLFGDLFPVAVVGVYVPMWFIEGDAVCFETAIGNLGRGRSPEFLNDMKAQIVEKGIYKYPKAVLGSCKDHVPNRYALGYFMTAQTRIDYTPDIWAQALCRTGRRPYGITPFNRSLRLSMQGKRDSLWQSPRLRTLFASPNNIRDANTRRNPKRTLYRDNFAQLRQLWEAEATRTPNRFDTLPTHDKYYTNYYYPTPTSPGDVIAYQQGLRQAGAFVRFSNGKPHLLTRTAALDDYKFAFNGTQILWSEYHPHIRWAQGGRLVLSCYDLQTKQYHRIRSPHNLVAPFTAGNNWGYVEITRQNKASIVLIDSAFQREIFRVTANNDELFIHPSWHEGELLTVVQSPRGIRLESIRLSDSTRHPFTPDLHYELDNPVRIDSLLLYRASYNGNNALYRHTPSNTTHLLGARFGIRFPHPDTLNNRLLFSFYTADGYKTGAIPLDRLYEEAAQYNRFPLADSIATQEHWHPTSFSADSLYPTRRYRQFLHLINIHSWGPLYADLYDGEVDLGAVIYSQNKLSTLSFAAGYLRRSGYDHGNWLLKGTYSGQWPVIDFLLKSGRYDYYSLNQALNLRADTTEYLYIHNKSRQSSAQLTLRLPLNLSARQYNRTLQPYVRYKINALHGQQPHQLYRYHIENDIAWLIPVRPTDYHTHTLTRLYHLFEYGIAFSNATRMSPQEINPRWEQTLSAGFTHSPWGNLNPGNQWWTDVHLYLPGAAFAHSVSLYGGFQHMSEHERHYNNKILYPRGITLLGYEISSLRCNYSLPIAFPDWNIGSLLYLKTLHGSLFYDFGTSRTLHGTRQYTSYGIELTTDSHFLNLTYPIHWGIRTGYETQHKRLFADFIFSIGISI